MKFGVKSESAARVTRNLRQLANNVQKELGAALYAEAEIEMTEAKKRTPVDTGTLRNSGYVEKPVEKGNHVVVEMGFGGPAADYAIYVHEDLEAFHPVGQAKFLESVVIESRPHLAARVARRIKLYGR
jgi:hypothetical protein